MLGMPFYFVASIWKKNETKTYIDLSQTGLKPVRRERELVNQHQPFQGPVKELYNSHQPVQSSVQLPFLYVQSSISSQMSVLAQSSISAQSSVSSQSTPASSSHITSSSSSSKVNFLGKTANVFTFVTILFLRGERLCIK